VAVEARHRGRCSSVLCVVFAAACSGVFERRRPEVAVDWCSTTVVADTIRVGSAERDITPSVGGYLGGFDIGRRSTAVDAPLRVRAMVVVAGERRIAIVGIDNLGLMREDADWIKQGLAGFALGDVFLCASHTHAGPDLIGLWGSWFVTSGRDPGYVARLRRETAAAVAAALADAALLPASGLVKNANRGGCFDRRIVVLHARARADGRPVGTLLHLACHPEVLPRGNAAISSDFVGALCDDWRERGLGQAVFVNGALGAMISPDYKPRAGSGAVAMGRSLAALAAASLATARPLPVDAVEVRRRDVYLPIGALAFRLGRLTMVLQREQFDGCARSTVGWLRLGTFEAVAVPGEMEPALAERLRAELGRPELVVFGLCDDELGYLLREQDARDPAFAYERSMSVCLRAGELVRQALTGVP
jgi:hypothetical protein